MKRLYKLIVVFCAGFLLFNVSGCVDLTPALVEVTTDEAVFENLFYYEHLSEKEQLGYRELYEGIIMQEEEIYIHPITSDEVSNILYGLLYDFPNIFWTEGACVSTLYGETLFSKGFTTVEMDYLYSIDERNQKEEEIRRAAEEIVKSVPKEYGEYEKIKYIYEYLVTNVDYVEDAPDNQNVYSALVGKQTVCAGYARAIQYLLNELGIYNIYVTGTATNEEDTDDHAWNIVQCNGSYYYVDVTWADPLFMEEQVRAEEIIYDYLCCSESVLSETHILDEGFQYPECQSDDLDYYRMNGLFYESAEKKSLLSAMKNSINEKEDITLFKFANDEVYEMGKRLMIDKVMNLAGQYLCEKYHLDEVEYLYQEDPALNKFVVYWQYE